MLVGKAIYDILTNDSTIEGLVADKVFPNVAAQTTEFPFIVYDVTSDDPEDTKDGVSTLDANSIMVSGYADNYSRAADLAVAIRDALDRTSGTYAGVVIQTIQYQGYNDVFDDMSGSDGIYRKSLDFKVRLINT